MSTRIATDQVRLKRAYEAAESSDGLRVLVDRLWPRGVTREDAALDLWLKELAPSTGLRKWFGHDPARWPEFQRRYGEEVLGHPEAFEHLCDLARTQRVTLVFSAKDEDHNDAVVLRSLLLGAGKAE
ncbi:DUF488 domain-containing protein [Quisquiliibacterium transsilvanicum]|uniref:Uncharacterized protein YeaO (DUF488 family) n=1 Tax=Quisquiliibacterium transsilvanicum TaxID=1549638 RepID=A0A7W8HFE3_9BURK|nr:DUF488 domain-containing protein [Quisquiliibacterium transsilvanicum]MBB5270471.1 uncharacterized protein YeaO (DUF488 family) [Quisquiliibacterium transsilvanicum]